MTVKVGQATADLFGRPCLADIERHLAGLGIAVRKNGVAGAISGPYMSSNTKAQRQQLMTPVTHSSGAERDREPSEMQGGLNAEHRPPPALD